MLVCTLILCVYISLMPTSADVLGVSGGFHCCRGSGCDGCFQEMAGWIIKESIGSELAANHGKGEAEPVEQSKWNSPTDYKTRDEIFPWRGVQPWTMNLFLTRSKYVMWDWLNKSGIVYHRGETPWLI